jgi:hypothetical protein
MAAPADTEWLSIETSPGPFCGRCDTTKIIVAYDGRAWIEQGHWAGSYKNWRVVRREAQVEAEALASFRARLEAVRPDGVLALIDTPPCEEYWEDNSEVIVVWHDQRGESRLHYNFGCDPETRRDLRLTLRASPGDLRISDFHMLEWEPASRRPNDQIELRIRGGSDR